MKRFAQAVAVVDAQTFFLALEDLVRLPDFEQIPALRLDALSVKLADNFVALVCGSRIMNQIDRKSGLFLRSAQSLPQS